jgi:hypothetical protein
MPKNLNLNDDFSESDGCDVQEDRLSDVQEEGSLPFVLSRGIDSSNRNIEMSDSDSIS